MNVLSQTGWFLVVLVRGLLLWVLIPFAFLAWLLVHSWAQRVSRRQALCWYDGHLTRGLANGPFRLMIAPEHRHFGRIPRMAAVEPRKTSLFGMGAIDLVQVV
ncbi:hypothetical protein [Microbacterium maritypicum]|uniref:Uncharacterized protein n=1 Tax=Microbacterium maritypicum TaxID=33918 RepID=A0ACD4B6F5_MICMQ|nr:hypothetical protein [Microbacterium liquefaciens]MBP5802984.1 hypothetical protein [Microbacterium liquefaciens]UTT53168.1 hypothetical protein NMQ05_00910 [Microbacterium liquefaciens]